MKTFKITKRESRLMTQAKKIQTACNIISKGIASYNDEVIFRLIEKHSIEIKELETDFWKLIRKKYPKTIGLDISYQHSERTISLQSNSVSPIMDLILELKQRFVKNSQFELGADMRNIEKKYIDLIE